MTRIVLISDTHENNLSTKWDIPDGDILIHAGDGTARGKAESILKLGRELAGQPHRFKVYVPGNHDKLFRTATKAAVSMLATHGVITLIDEGIVLPPGVHVYGTPWQQVPYSELNLLRRLGFDSFTVLEAQEQYRRIPENVDILITHQPPAGILSLSEDGVELGSTQLTSELQMRLRPRLMVFGHIHEQYGYQWIDANPTLCVNAALCDPNNKPANPPVVVDIDEYGRCYLQRGVDAES